MNKHEFREWELTEKAFYVYSNSDLVFYTDGKSYLMAENNNSVPLIEFNTIKDVEEYLLQFAE